MRWSGDGFVSVEWADGGRDRRYDDRMQRIQAGAAHLLTGDQTATLLFDYAKVLGEVKRSDSVLIPTVDTRGVQGTALFLVDPATPFFASPVATQGREPDDETLLTEIRVRIRRIRPDYYDDPEGDSLVSADYDDIVDLL